VDEVARSQLPIEHSGVPLEVRAFRSRLEGTEHLALIRHRPASHKAERIQIAD
jgi:3,4-dihydroxy 2-butanone 4-phosphate synthase/GTP cyclohydrolase II